VKSFREISDKNMIHYSQVGGRWGATPEFPSNHYRHDAKICHVHTTGKWESGGEPWEFPLSTTISLLMQRSNMLMPQARGGSPPITITLIAKIRVAVATKQV